MAMSSKRRRSSGSHKRHSRKKLLRYLGPAVAGFGAAVVLISLSSLMLRSGARIVTKPSPFGLAQTVETLQRAATDRGLVVVAVVDMGDFVMSQWKVPLAHQIKVIRLTKAGDLVNRLNDSPQSACVMPLGIAVWQDSDNKTQVSHLDPGNSARLVGEATASAEQPVVDAVTGDRSS